MEAIAVRPGPDEDRPPARERGIAAALRAAATVEGALASADVVGGTAPNRVAEQLAAAKARLGA